MTGNNHEKGAVRCERCAREGKRESERGGAMAGKGDARCVGKEIVRGGVREREKGSMREAAKEKGRGEVSAEVFDFTDLNIINISVPFLFCKRDD